MKHPVATYRIQLRPGFGFREAKDVVDWLSELGVTHAYASPYLAAQHGSTHGYDLTDPTRLNPELGTEDDYVDWTHALAERGMGHIVDVVPNHMVASTENRWWADVLENGPSSVYADYFDIEWHPLKDALENKVLLPVLGAQYGEVLEKGELRLERREGQFCIRYWERYMPVSPPSVAPVIERATALLAMPADDPRRMELQSIVTGLRNLPASQETDPERRAERAREKEVLKRRLAKACEDGEIAGALDREIARVNGAPGDPRSFDDLDRLLLDQCYRLAFWRVATEEINYRRFFDVNDLAAVRMEEEAVFTDAHALLFRQIEEGRLQGLRLDHIDGLSDPEDYVTKLRRRTNGVYIVCEKILAHAEELPQDWPVDGTTGYDFLGAVSSLFVDRRSEQTCTRIYQAVTGDTAPYQQHVLDAKRSILRSSLSSELHMLAVRLERVAMRDRRSRDFTLAMLRRALGETIASFPVYRTYVRPDGTTEPPDEATLTRAVRLARKRNPDMSPSVFDFVRDVLLLRGEHEDRAARIEVAMRFQQLTGPVAAKGVEDTAFYTYLRFVALNEVGGAPDRFGTTIAEFHEQNAARREKWPRSMTALATHDTKRGADVRARLAVLSELPDEWESWVSEWMEIAKRHARAIDEEPAPSLADQYLFLQTALGAYPLEGGMDQIFVDRLVAYMSKAAREAKRRTSWLSPDDAYEEALREFIVAMTSDEAFAKSLAERAARVATHGASNGLAMVTLEIASPGVPDTYQGGETWDLSLVDPDNRAPVDYELRRHLLRRCENARARDLLAMFADSRVKLHVLRAALRLRREKATIFVDGDYTPIDAGDEIVAFTRRHESGRVVAAVTRLPVAAARDSMFAVGEAWGERSVAVPRGTWRDAFTGREHDVADDGLRARELFAELPVALLYER